MCADENEGPAPCLPGLGCRGRCDLILFAFPGMFPAIDLPVCQPLTEWGCLMQTVITIFPKWPSAQCRLAYSPWPVLQEGVLNKGTTVSPEHAVTLNDIPAFRVHRVPLSPDLRAFGWFPGFPEAV